MHILHIYITKNNLKLSISDLHTGNLIYWTNLGSSNFRKDQCNSEAATSGLASILCSKIMDLKLKVLGIYIKGVTRWKGTILREIFKKLSKFLKILFIRDITPLPFNGCSPKARPRKRKRTYKKSNKRFFSMFVIPSKFKLTKQYSSCNITNI